MEPDIADGIPYPAPEVSRFAALLADTAELALAEDSDDELQIACEIIARDYPTAEVLPRTANYLIDSGRHSIADMVPSSDRLQ